MFQTLSRRATNDGRYGPPLCWHQFGQMEKFLFLFTTPFSLLDTRIQPFKPTNKNEGSIIIQYTHENSLLLNNN